MLYDAAVICIFSLTLQLKLMWGNDLVEFASRALCRLMHSKKMHLKILGKNKYISPDTLFCDQQLFSGGSNCSSNSLQRRSCLVEKTECS